MVYKLVRFDTVGLMAKDFRELDDKFAAAFRIARDQAELSQEAVADRMREFGFDMSQPVIGKIERGMRRVSIGEAEALSSAVGNSLSGLLAGPSYLKAEAAQAGLRGLRAGLKEAVNRFQSGQAALALFADGVQREGEIDAYTAETFEQAITETVEDVLQEVKHDNLAANAGRKLRDEMDMTDEEKTWLPRQYDPETYFGRYMAGVGDEVDQTPNGDAFAAIFGIEIRKASDG